MKLSDPQLRLSRTDSSRHRTRVPSHQAGIYIDTNYPYIFTPGHKYLENYKLFSMNGIELKAATANVKT